MSSKVYVAALADATASRLLPPARRARLQAELRAALPDLNRRYRRALAARFAQGHGEAGGEGAAIAAIEVGERGPQLGLEPGAAGRGQQAGRRGVGEGGDVDLGGHFTSHVTDMTNNVTIYQCDDKCQSLIACRTAGRRRPRGR